MLSEIDLAVFLSSKYSIIVRANDNAVPAPFEVIKCLSLTVGSAFISLNDSATDGWHVIEKP